MRRDMLDCASAMRRRQHGLGACRQNFFDYRQELAGIGRESLRAAVTFFHELAFSAGRMIVVAKLVM